MRDAQHQQQEQRNASIELQASPSSPGAARAFVTRVLGEWHCDHLVDNALLVASELVTNAVLHARSPSTLRLVLRDGTVRIQVADCGGGVPEPRVPDAERPGGRGLPIIEAISTAWGIDPIPEGKMVWAELDG